MHHDMSADEHDLLTPRDQTGHLVGILIRLRTREAEKETI